MVCFGLFGANCPGSSGTVLKLASLSQILDYIYIIFLINKMKIVMHTLQIFPISGSYQRQNVFA